MLFIDRTTTGQGHPGLRLQHESQRPHGHQHGQRGHHGLRARRGPRRASPGVLYGMKYIGVPAASGNITLKSFIAAVFGGLGSLPGAVLGSVLLGLIETLVAGYLSVAVPRPHRLRHPDRRARSCGPRASWARPPRTRHRGRHGQLHPGHPHAGRHQPRGGAGPLPPDGLHRPLLLRPRRLHGHRRLRRGRLTVTARGILAWLPFVVGILAAGPRRASSAWLMGRHDPQAQGRLLLHRHPGLRRGHPPRPQQLSRASAAPGLA
ncbi:MAG: hypothetical protein MZV64_09375 [Ignavibacteriales bacterium]|nr:hypothetical protein [Ignavibacteriales bacterium]